jgi:hypothetical protein
MSVARIAAGSGHIAIITAVTVIIRTADPRTPPGAGIAPDAGWIPKEEREIS